jgi:MFS family permease
MTQATTTQRKLAAIPGGVWALGFVSMLMDISSEMIHALLPLYLVVALSTSALTVGIIEGIAEATALVTKVFSGALSDRLGKRKFLAALGYGLAAFTKPIFPLASTLACEFHHIDQRSIARGANLLIFYASPRCAQKRSSGQWRHYGE